MFFGVQALDFPVATVSTPHPGRVLRARLAAEVTVKVAEGCPSTSHLPHRCDGYDPSHLMVATNGWVGVNAYCMCIYIYAHNNNTHTHTYTDTHTHLIIQTHMYIYIYVYTY